MPLTVPVKAGLCVGAMFTPKFHSSIVPSGLILEIELAIKDTQPVKLHAPCLFKNAILYILY
jgi:hypothetical protein